MEFKIYTKTGDTGETSLFGGKRLPKDDIRIEAYGTVDELNAYIGLLRDHLKMAAVTAVLEEVQTCLFTIGSNLANDPTKNLAVPKIKEADIALLERTIDEMETELEPLKNFILPGGHVLASHAHVARTICRRAERRVITLNRENPVDPILIRYLNRLSDYLFVLARKFTGLFNVQEIVWNPKKE